jgi:hypothetical protein
VEFLKSFDLSLWWRALIAVGLALVVAALAGKDRPVLIVGFGFIVLGFGEWFNHPQVGRQVGGMLESWFERRPCMLGLLLDAAGALLIALGGWRILIA